MEADHLNFSIRQWHWMSRVHIWEGHTMRKPPSINGMRCQEYETQWGRTHCGYLKRMYCEKPLSINSIECREYIFEKDSGIRKTEKVLQEPGISASFTSEYWNSIWRSNVMRQNNGCKLWFKGIEDTEYKQMKFLGLDNYVRATPKPASSMAHSTVTRALALWAHT